VSWKCDICDTYNEERETACYVCGQARSAASIREGKIRAREERILRINNAIYKCGYSISKGIFLVGLLSSLVVIVIATIIKISQGDIGGIATNLFGVFNHFGDKISVTVPHNVTVVYFSISEAPYLDVGRNIEYVLYKWGTMVSLIPALAQEVFINTAKNNFEQGYISCIECLKNQANVNLSNIGLAIKKLLDNAVLAISNIVDIIKSVSQNVKQYF